jgi:hypothetical protein
MTELAEPVAFGVVTATDAACPFDHTSLTPPTVENDFVGDASTLASSMRNKVSSVLYDPFKPTTLTSIISPNDDPKHPFWDGHTEADWPVKIRWTDKKTGASGVHAYPVTAAAHHVIPAQESLKRAVKLHKFMIKKGATENVANGKSITTVTGGIVYSDLGYNVNGSENGIFLPGNYAVTALTMDDPHWTPAPSVLSDVDWESGESPDNENVGQPKLINSPKLTGDRHQINALNRKWQYVRQSVQKGGQFHDRHGDYSEWVVKALEQLATQLANQYTKSVSTDCSDCKERAKKFTPGGLGIPTPFSLVSKMNNVSARTMAYLKGGIWVMPIVTSKWGVANILAKRTNNPEAL